jgi:hypothetical protein
MLLALFGVGPSLLLPWLTVVVVQDNAEGIFELLFVQGLRVPAHVAGTLLYSFAAMTLTHAVVFSVSVIFATPAVIKLPAARWALLLLALTVQVRVCVRACTLRLFLICSQPWTSSHDVLVRRGCRCRGQQRGELIALSRYRCIFSICSHIFLILNDPTHGHHQAAWTACVTILCSASFKSTWTAAGVVGLGMMTGVGVGLALVMLQGIISGQPDDDLNDQSGFFYEPYPTALSLAPYFGFFRALFLIGNGNQDGDVIVALALTVVQAIVFLAAGTIVYVPPLHSPPVLSPPPHFATATATWAPPPPPTWTQPAFWLLSF